jgi:predicted nucleic acid-binding protein
MIAIDTNIYAYTIDGDSTTKLQRSVELILSLPDEMEHRPLLWQVACEFLAFLRRQQDKKRIEEADIRHEMNLLMSGNRLVVPSANVLMHAMDLQSRYSLSHWDSLLIAACVEADVDTFYSEDMGHRSRYDSVTVINPFKNV